VDCEGEKLRKALSAGVYLVKPNLGELEAITGKQYINKAQMIEGAKKLIAMGSKYVLLSLGQSGAILTDGTNHLYCRSANVAVNSTVGAGDSMIAAASLMIEEGKCMEEVLRAAVAAGTGMAGCHGGMCDAFRNSTSWQFMTGSQWVAHPGNSNATYRVNMKKSASSPIIEGIDDFEVTSEQYYIHVDPAVNVLATTRFPTVEGNHSPNGEVDVPVVYTKRWGKGRVFYNSLGHTSEIFKIPEAKELMRRGFLYAAR
jgi:type 1 glutamine amidotransferase